MRKYIALLTTALLFFSCSKQENAPEVPAPHSPIGSWQLMRLTEHRVFNGIARDTVYTDAEECYIRFSDDQTGELDSPTGKSMLELSGHYTFDWSISGNKITANCTNGHNELTDVWQIKSLTETDLVLYWKDEGYNITATFVKRPD